MEKEINTMIWATIFKCALKDACSSKFPYRQLCHNSEWQDACVALLFRRNTFYKLGFLSFLFPFSLAYIFLCFIITTNTPRMRIDRHILTLLNWKAFITANS